MFAALFIEGVDLARKAAAAALPGRVRRWIAKRRAEERDVQVRPHPYEIELYYGM